MADPFEIEAKKTETYYVPEPKKPEVMDLTAKNAPAPRQNPFLLMEFSGSAQT